MLKQVVEIIALLLSACWAWSETVPGYATELPPYSASAHNHAGVIRMRITVAGATAQAEKSVRLGDVVLCSLKDCYRAHTSGYATIANTSHGTAEILADVSMPVSILTDVYFTEVAGNPVLGGHLKLGAPVAIEQGMQGIELFIVVRKQQSAGRTTYAPIQLASMYFNAESELVHYLPTIQTVAALSQGTILTIPAGALDSPRIFHVGVLDAGGMFPKIDIYPYIKLNKAAIIEVPAIAGRSATQETIVPVIPAKHDSLSSPRATSDSINSARVTFSRTGIIQPSN